MGVGWFLCAFFVGGLEKTNGQVCSGAVRPMVIAVQCEVGVWWVSGGWADFSICACWVVQTDVVLIQRVGC